MCASTISISGHALFVATNIRKKVIKLSKNTFIKNILIKYIWKDSTDDSNSVTNEV